MDFVSTGFHYVDAQSSDHNTGEWLKVRAEEMYWTGDGHRMFMKGLYLMIPNVVAVDQGALYKRSRGLQKDSSSKVTEVLWHLPFLSLTYRYCHRPFPAKIVVQR